MTDKWLARIPPLKGGEIKNGKANDAMRSVASRSYWRWTERVHRLSGTNVLYGKWALRCRVIAPEFGTQCMTAAREK